jgi:hypothetical protein
VVVGFRFSNEKQLMSQLDSEIMLGSIYDATPISKAKARRVILAHDDTAIDILEILGLNDE